MDPFIDLGPVSLSVHGLTTSLGLIVGGLLAARYAKRVGLDPEEILRLAVPAAVAGLVGARLLYLLENAPEALLSPTDWFGTNGFSVYGGLIVGAAAIALTLRRRRLSLDYLDAAALGLPLGMAIGRVGDVVNGEHFGPPSQLPWAVRNPHPDASVPDAAIAYHSGGLYEIVLSLLILMVVLPLRHRLREPGSLAAVVVCLYASGRFAMFFVRSDSAELALGLSTTQWISALLVAAGLLAWTVIRRRCTRHEGARGDDPTLCRTTR